MRTILNYRLVSRPMGAGAHRPTADTFRRHLFISSSLFIMTLLGTLVVLLHLRRCNLDVLHTYGTCRATQLHARQCIAAPLFDHNDFYPCTLKTIYDHFPQS